MVGLGRIKCLDPVDARYDGTLEDLQLIKLLDVGLGDALLVVTRIENDRAILRTDIRTLPIELRRILRYRKKI